MKRAAFVVSAFAALLIVSVGCGGGSDDVMAPAGTQMSVVASPTAGTTGYPVTFTVTANNSQTVLTSVSIDFTSDGTWDEVQSFGQSSITAAFSHVYVNAGTFTVRAEVKDANNVPTIKTAVVGVSAPPTPPVSVVVRGQPNVGGSANYLAVCAADGPPTACDGCTRSLDAEGTRISLGSLPSGTPVSFTQAFSQYSTFRYQGLTIHYSCYFDVYFYAGTPGSEVQFGSGSCNTQSQYPPTNLTCSITASGTVP